MDPHSYRKPWRMRKRNRKPHAQSDTTIESLSDDVLGDILVRLPSPASLGRAALACPRWRRLASSRHFLRRYRALHPLPPLMGYFTSFDGILPEFHRVPDFPDRDVAAAARGGDFLFTSFTDVSHWAIRDCCDGLFLLFSPTYNELAIFDPVSRRRVRVPCPPHTVVSRVWGKNYHVCLLPSCGGGVDDGSDASVRVVSLELEHGYLEKTGAVRAHVCSLRTGEWRSLQWVPPLGDYSYSRFSSSQPMHAAKRIYWKCVDDDPNCKVLFSLNTETMELSYVALPLVPGLFSGSRSYVVGDTEYGACCLVSAPTPHHDALRVWLRNDEDEVWELQTLKHESPFFRCGSDPKKYQVRAMTNGLVLLDLFRHHGQRDYYHRYIALDIKREELRL